MRVPRWPSDATNRRRATLRLLAGFEMAVGVTWLLTLGWIFLMMSGIADPVSPLYTAAYYAVQVTGPLAMIAGAKLVGGTRAIAGLALIAVSCVGLTLIIGDACVSSIHPGPLEAPPPYGEIGTLAGVVLLADLAAFRLFQLVRTRSPRLEL